MWSSPETQRIDDYCKKELIECLQNFAKNLGFKSVFVGTNFSDLGGHLPGLKAIKEGKNVFTPWVENEFTKEDIRTLAKNLGLSIYNKPELACLASRISFGEQITEEKLNRVERAELLLKKTFSIRQLRVRDHNGLARIEVGRDERYVLYSRDVEIMDKLAEELKRLGFKYVTLDLEGYKRGSMLAAIEMSENKP